MIETKLWGRPCSDEVGMRIICQSERRFRNYRCSNGIFIKSITNPALLYGVGGELTVFTRGNSTTRDNQIARLYTPNTIRSVLRIKEALDEFNREVSG